VNALIGEMRTLSLMESTRQLPKPDFFAISDLFQNLLPDMNFEAHARGCKVVFKLVEGDLEISGQQEMLRRAFENIIRNAIRYTPSGENITIEVSENTSLSSGTPDSAGTPTSLTLRMRDRGPGVPKANLPHIFRAFYRVDMARQGTLV
jgi:two-component system, OmpR family, sensor histidine kinase CpxA